MPVCHLVLRALICNMKIRSPLQCACAGERVHTAAIVRPLGSIAPQRGICIVLADLRERYQSTYDLPSYPNQGLVYSVFLA
jgi:hypothetical protein